MPRVMWLKMEANMRGLLALGVVAFVLFAGAGVTIEVLALSPDTLHAIADK